MRILLTGGAGFVGHHFVEHLLKETDAEIVLLDRIDHGGNLNRLKESEPVQSNLNRISWHWHDLKAPFTSQLSRQIGRVNTIIHLAAASHVDRSIEDPMAFIMDNVIGTCNILNYARDLMSLDRMLYFSTDEVFGPAPGNVEYLEWDRYNSSNPYAASKAGAEELCLAFCNTYKLPVMISHCMNIFGERQHPEKFIPSTIKKVNDGSRITIHADKDRINAGSRFYIHARNVADAALFILKNGKSGDKYNIVGEIEIDNLSLAQMIAKIIGKRLEYEMVDFHSSRPGHDLRYALSGKKMEAMGWKPPVTFEYSLKRMIRWTLDNPQWLEG